MRFDTKIKDEICSEFKTMPNGMKLKHWLLKHPNVKEYAESVLADEKRFNCFSNVIWCLINDFDIDEYKCKECRQINGTLSSHTIKQILLYQMCKKQSRNYK